MMQAGRLVPLGNIESTIKAVFQGIEKKELSMWTWSRFTLRLENVQVILDLLMHGHVIHTNRNKIHKLSM